MKTRKLSICNRLFLLFAFLLFAGIGTLGCFSYAKARSALFMQIQKNAINIASCAAASIDSELLQTIQSGDEETDNYKTLVNQMSLFRDNAELEYIYTLKLNGNTVEYVVDADPKEPASIGDVCESTPAMRTALQSNTTVADEEMVTDEWGTHLSAYSSVLADNGKVVGAVGVDISADWISGQISGIRNMILIIAATTGAVSLVGLYLLVHRLRKNIFKLNGKITELNSGNGDLTKKIKITTGDEFEIIAANVNQFIEQIQGLVKDVSSSTKSLGETSEQLNNTISDNLQTYFSMNSQIEEITASMEESSASSQVMEESLTLCQESIEQFAESVSRIAIKSADAKTRASVALDTASQNRATALSTMKDLKRQITKINEDIQNIKQVQTIAEEVSKIAGQTNMLSLNASIEAARAGTQGKGFAVVAAQVGKLSQDINKAVAQINQINKQVLSAVGILSETTESIERFITEDVVKDYDTFASISEEYGKTTLFIESETNHLATESVSILTKIHEANEQVHMIAEMVRSTSEGAVELAASTSQLTHSMETLSENSKNNTENSEALAEQVRKYKY